MKSPGTNSPLSSTKKQRSASPSYATPKAAPSSVVRAHDELAVLGQERVRLVVRERPVGLEVAADDLDLRQPLEHRAAASRRPSRSRRRPRSGAARSPRRRRTPSTRSTKPSQTSTGSTEPPRRAAPLAAHGAVADLERARTRSPTGSAPRRTIFIPVYSRRVVRGRDHDPAVEAELAGREVDHLRPDHPEVGHVGAAVGDAVDHGRRPSRATRAACRARPRSAAARTAPRTRARPRTRPPRRAATGRARARRTP